MPRTVSSEMLQAMYAQETGEAILCLITVDHDDLAAPIRVTSDAVDTESNGHTFIAYPFQVVLPDEPEDDRAPLAKLTISNVDREILAALRAISSPASVTMEIVRGSDPDTVEVSFPDFKMRAVPYTALTVSAELMLDDYTTEPWPADTYVPSTHPALFS